MADDFAMRLIAAEENQRQSVEASDGDKENLLLIQQDGLVEDSRFSPTSEDISGDVNQFPIEDAGELDTLVIVADDPDFSVGLVVDNNVVLDERPYSYIENFSTELSHIGAYEKNGDNVVSVTSYPFDEHLDVTVIPDKEINFKLVRAEIILGEEVSSTVDSVDPEFANLLQ